MTAAALSYLIQAGTLMARRRILKSVLHNFLGTFTSRYTDYKGYWLFGFVVSELGQIGIDLLRTPPDSVVSAIDAATEYATRRFREQLGKTGLNSAQIQDALLTISTQGSPVSRADYGHFAEGRMVSFKVQVKTDLGRVYALNRDVFVAPHNASVEYRSNRSTE